MGLSREGALTSVFLPSWAVETEAVVDGRNTSPRLFSKSSSPESPSNRVEVLAEDCTPCSPGSLLAGKRLPLLRRLAMVPVLLTSLREAGGGVSGGSGSAHETPHLSLLCAPNKNQRR